ncbi:MAG: carbon-phosphorus lyase complex subunit PhnI [Oscillospiraceae bacterium]|nr:carbon-phosphorus lyase complex subunit PhnI [Oscillospiraceae bacterium]
MAYVAVKGGEAAIEKSIELLKLSRSEGKNSLETEVITSRMKQLVDRVMCEAGFYAPLYAAISLKQNEGSLEEAVFLMRAYRSTLTRSHTSLELDCREMRLTRRISSAFKDIPLGQILGPTYDYTHRLINFDLLSENEEELEAFKDEFLGNIERLSTPMKAARVSDLLREENLIADYEKDNTEPEDITQEKFMFPASRSVKLQTLFRADTGFISGVAYSGMRGYGASAHPTIGELRCGYMEIEIAYPLDTDESMVLGEILFTEVEAYIGSHISTSGAHDGLGIAIGYGLVFGRAETRAIAMSILDCALNNPDPSNPPNDEEFVLLHGEPLEMSGFISHLKLPHYVTYQSRLDNIRKIRRENQINGSNATSEYGEELCISDE